MLLVATCLPICLSEQRSTLQAQTEKDSPKDLHIYLLIGQSNMAGRATFSEEDAQPISNCYLFDDKEKWIPASNPLNRFSTIRKDIKMQKMNPGYGFAKTLLAKNPQQQIGLVVNAKGGTRIEQWAKGTKFYNDAIARTRKAMANGQLQGILWHQGEGNSAKPLEYLPKLKKLIADLRKDLKVPDVPFVAGQIVGKEKINDEIAKLPAEVPHTGVASSNGLTAFDRWHFDTRSMKSLGARYAEQILTIQGKSADDQKLEDALSTRENFEVAGRPAFVMLPKQIKKKPIPWVWYAPTLGKNLPGGAEKWMFDRFHQAGIAIAGIDVGESYGSPKGREQFQELYQHLVSKREFGKHPVLLARSRGGLMLYSWATEHPDKVGGVAGIYPVCNIASYPGVKRAANAFELKPEDLETSLKLFNPIDRLESLAKNKVPIFHIHGDNDKVVPLDANSAIVEKRYKEFGGPVEILIVKGQGHNMWSGWFTSQRLLDFVVKNAISQ